MIRVDQPAERRRPAAIVTNLVTNFTSFVPLGTVLVAMLGVGVAERSGLLGAADPRLVLNARAHTVTVTIVFAGVLSNTASEMGYVVLVPLAAVVFTRSAGTRWPASPPPSPACPAATARTC
jgi:aminobenzoyl-glutamate transport protein